MNPLMRIPFIQIILRFAPRSPSQLHEFSHVSSPWRETVSFHSDKIWGRKHMVEKSSISGQFLACLLHGRIQHAQLIYHTYRSDPKFKALFVSSVTNKFLQPYVLHYLGIEGEYKRDHYLNKSGKTCEQYNELDIILVIIRETTVNDRFFRKLVEALKWHLEHIEDYRGSNTINILFEARDLEVMKMIRTCFIDEAFRSAIMRGISGYDKTAVFLVCAGCDYRLISEYWIQYRYSQKMDVDRVTLRKAMNEIAEEGDGYKQRPLVSDDETQS